jgi:hypothetical protein
VFNDMPSSGNKSRMYGGRIASYGTTDLDKGPALFPKFPRAFYVEGTTGKSMEPGVFRLGHKLKVTDSIVLSIPVFVMYFFAASKAAAYFLFHQVTVNFNALTRFKVLPAIACASHRFVFAGHVISAQGRTEESFVAAPFTFLHIFRQAGKHGFAPWADKFYNFGSHLFSPRKRLVGQSPRRVWKTWRGLDFTSLKVGVQ